MRFFQAIRCGAVALLVAAAACEARDLFSLGTALHREFADPKFGVALTDQVILTVTVTDSSLARASCDSQVAFAMRVATFAREHYASFDSLQLVNVAFVAGRGREVPPGHARLPIRFARTAIGAGLGAADSTRAAESCRAFEALQ